MKACGWSITFTLPSWLTGDAYEQIKATEWSIPQERSKLEHSWERCDFRQENMKRG